MVKNQTNRGKKKQEVMSCCEHNSSLLHAPTIEMYRQLVIEHNRLQKSFVLLLNEKTINRKKRETQEINKYNNHHDHLQDHHHQEENDDGCTHHNDHLHHETSSRHVKKCVSLIHDYIHDDNHDPSSPDPPSTRSSSTTSHTTQCCPSSSSPSSSSTCDSSGDPNRLQHVIRCCNHHSHQNNNNHQNEEDAGDGRDDDGVNSNDDLAMDWGKKVAGFLHREQEDVNNLKQEIQLMSLELQGARDMNELLEFRILELEIVEKSEILKSTLAIYERENNELRGKLQKLENREKDLMDENMRLYLDGIQLRDEISLLIDMKGSTPSDDTNDDQQKSSPVQTLIIPTSTCPASSEDEGLGDLDSATRSREGSVAEEDHRSLSPEDDNSSSSTSSSGVKSVFSSRSSGSVCLSSPPSSSLSSSTHAVARHDASADPDSPAYTTQHTENATSESPTLDALYLCKSCQTDIAYPTPFDQVKHTHQGIGVSGERFKVPLENRESKRSTDDEVTSLERVIRERDMLKMKLEKVSQEKDSLAEQVLELEEAENDARFASQRLETQVTGLLQQIESLQITLVQARSTIDEDQKQLREHQEAIQRFKRAAETQASKPATVSKASKAAQTDYNRSSDSHDDESHIEGSSRCTSTPSTESTNSQSHKCCRNSIRRDDPDDEDQRSSTRIIVSGSQHNGDRREDRMKHDEGLNGSAAVAASPSSSSASSSSSCLKLFPQEFSGESFEKIDTHDDEFTLRNGRLNLWDDIQKLEAEISSCSRSVVEQNDHLNDERAGQRCNRSRKRSERGPRGSSVDTGCDDLQFFISEDVMRENPGSCFEASTFRVDHQHLPNHQVNRRSHNNLHDEREKENGMRQKSSFKRNNRLENDQETPDTADDNAPHDFDKKSQSSLPSSQSSFLPSVATSSSSYPSSHSTSLSSSSSDREAASDAHCEQKNLSSSPLPICERVKAKKIEIILHPTSHYLKKDDEANHASDDHHPDVNEKTKGGGKKNQGSNDRKNKRDSCDTPLHISSGSSPSPSASSSPTGVPPAVIIMSEMSRGILNLERNERQLKEKLMQLEWINKEFVRELEMREVLFLTRESEEREWKKIKSNHDQDIHDLNLLQKQIQQRIFRLQQQEEKRRRRERRDGEEDSHLRSDSIINNREITISSLQGDQNPKWMQMMIPGEQEVMRQRRVENDLMSDPDADHQHHNQHQNLQEKKTEEQNFPLLIENLQKQESELQKEISLKETQVESLRMVHEERIRIVDEEHARVAQGLVDKMQEMESTSGSTVKQLEEQRHQLCSQLEQNFREFQEREENLRKKITQLEKAVIHIKLTEFHRNHEQNVISSLEKQLEDQKEKVAALTNEASAYKETISNADIIVEDLEKEYRERITQLEASQHDLQQKLQKAASHQHSKSPTSTQEKKSHRNNNHNEDEEEKSNLVQELEDAETRESRLRENLNRLETSERISREKIKKLESEKSTLESELQEYEKLLSTVSKLKNEVECLKEQIRQYENDQEELQQCLHQSQSFHSQKENQLNQEIQRLKHDRSCLELSLMDLRNRYDGETPAGSNGFMSSRNLVESHPDTNSRNDEEDDENSSWL